MEGERFTQLKPISEALRKPLGKQAIDNFKMIFTHDWIFGSAFEKIIIVGMFVWSIYSIIKFVGILIK